MAGRNLSKGLQKISSEQPLLYFLIVAVAVSVLGNAVYQFLTNVTGTSKWAVAGIAIISVLVLLWAAWHVERIIKFSKPANPAANESRPLQRKGLILLVSKEETCRKAIEWHQQRLERCWLVCSE
jgi:predicted PurR-regulated permease PerM